MKKINQKSVSTVYFSVLIFSSFLTLAYAQRSSFEMMKELEEREKQQPAAQPQEAFVRPAVEYKAEDLRDPFLELGKEMPSGEPAPTKEPVQLPPLKVQGLIWGGKFPQAIINDSVLKAGETIQGAHIINIDKNGVLIEYEGQEFNCSAPAAGGEPDGSARRRPPAPLLVRGLGLRLAL